MAAHGNMDEAHVLGSEKAVEIEELRLGDGYGVMGLALGGK